MTNRGNAYLTVYLTLILAVILSLCLTLTEGVRRNAFYLESECITDIGLNSVLAEYHRGVLEQYNLFAVDSSYGTELSRMQNVGNRLEFYLNKNMSQKDVFLDWLLYRDLLGMRTKKVEVERVRLLTDGNGSVFRRRAAEAMLDDLNITLLEEWRGWMETVVSEQLTERDIAEEKQRLDAELEEYEREEQISETEWETITVDNPTDHLEAMRRKGILALVFEDMSGLSERSICRNMLVMERMQQNECNRGNLALEENPFLDETKERFLFQNYLLRYLKYYGAENGKRNHVSEPVLLYEVEYLLGGCDTDLDNLRYVLQRIFTIREVSNTVYLYSDQGKCKIAELLAFACCSLVGLPEASDVLQQILLMGWAFAESVYDVKSLISGGQVPLMKQASTWHYDLEHVLASSGFSGDCSGKGMSYADYLMVLLTLETEENLTLRAMNVVEANIRNMPGNDFFRLDACVDSLEAKVTVQSAYGYDCEIRRQKGYSMQ